MPDAPTLSVVTPTYNRAQTFLPQTVESIARARLPEGFTVEHIIVNDASVDETEELLYHLQACHAHIRVINLRNHVGPGPARNAGLTIARGEYVVDLDDDDLVPLRGLELRLNVMRASQRHWAIGDVLVIGEDGRQLPEEALSHVPVEGDDECFIALYEDRLHAWASANIYRTSLVREVGGWGVAPPDVAEDLILWLKYCEAFGAPEFLLEPTGIFRRKDRSLGIDNLRSGQLAAVRSAINEQFSESYSKAVARVEERSTGPSVLSG